MRLSFGSYLKKLRKDHKLTLRAVATNIDIDQSSLSKIEKGKMISPPYVIKALAALYQIEFRDMQVYYLSDKWMQTYAHVPFAIEALENALSTISSNSDSATYTNSRMISDLLSSYFSDRPVERVWLFGSAVRDKLTSESDIDLLIRFKKGHSLDLFDYMTMKDDIAELVKRPVDLVVEGQLDAMIVDRVESEKELIYEQAE